MKRMVKKYRYKYPFGPVTPSPAPPEHLAWSTEWLANERAREAAMTPEEREAKRRAIEDMFNDPDITWAGKYQGR